MAYPEFEFWIARIETSAISRFTNFDIQNSLSNVNSAARNLFQISKSALLDVQNSNFSYVKF
jgi:hypothetical protein